MFVYSVLANFLTLTEIFNYSWHQLLYFKWWYCAAIFLADISMSAVWWFAVCRKRNYGETSTIFHIFMPKLCWLNFGFALQSIWSNYFVSGLKTHYSSCRNHFHFCISEASQFLSPCIVMIIMKHSTSFYRILPFQSSFINLLYAGWDNNYLL